MLWLYKTIMSFFGMSSEAFHTANLVLHSLNAMLLAYSVQLVFGFKRNPYSKNIVLLTALSLAALWAWHPMRVEPVSWVTVTTYHVSTSFFLLAIIACIKYLSIEHGTLIRGASGRRWEILHYVFFGLSVFSYPIAYTWPLAVCFFLPLVTPDKRPWQAIRGHIRLPVIGGLIIAFPLAIMIWTRIHTTSECYAAIDLDIPLLEHTGILVKSIGFLAHRTLYPVALTPAAWSDAASYLPPTVAILAGLLVVSLVATFLFKSKLSRRLKWSCLAVIAISIPTVNPLEATVFLPDRYGHLTQCFIVVVASTFFLDFNTFRLRSLKWLNFVLILLAVTLASLSFAQLPVWRNSYTLFAHIEEQPWAKEPYSSYMLNRLKAGNYAWDGKYEEAIKSYHLILGFNPDESVIWHQIGLCYYGMAHYAEAEEFLKKAISQSAQPMPMSQKLLKHVQSLSEK